MKKTYAMIMGATAIGLLALAFFLTKPSGPRSSKSTATSDKIKEVDWKTLYQLNFETGEAPQEVKDLHNKMIKMPGYIVPLSDDYSILEEFLLVPDAQSCIHVPPPPPNLIVHVKLDKPIPLKETSNPSWVYGILKIETTTSQYGSAAYKLDAKKLEKFVYPE